MNARIIVACGSGVATSQTVASKVSRLLKERNISADVNAVDLKSVDRYLRDADVYISIVNEGTPREVPVISGIPFLTGVGQDKALNDLINVIAG
ncbi:PTS sugar transporter subunit IIB [Cutibacterium modestum]|uniref:PTS sugar transporter subunit IIB n=1 Tax=Cutibacterium modestum TaxID=2559073 RepID=UPI000F04BBEE|nr:PTS sugar transporter subunit IIB [Cutibacterium modestum]MCP2378756.1 PTS system galactitol-specific enzyme IIB component [Cutibacterium modestum 31N]